MSLILLISLVSTLNKPIALYYHIMQFSAVSCLCTFIKSWSILKRICSPISCLCALWNPDLFLKECLLLSCLYTFIKSQSILEKTFLVYMTNHTYLCWSSLYVHWIITAYYTKPRKEKANRLKYKIKGLIKESESILQKHLAGMTNTIDKRYKNKPNFKRNENLKTKQKS